GQPSIQSPGPGFTPTPDCKGWLPPGFGGPFTPEQQKVQQGFAIAPVKLNMTGLNSDLVGLGSYLVNATNLCSDCHTAPAAYLDGGDPFLLQKPEKYNVAAYLAGGQEFGPFVSRNITPDASGRPAGLTFEQFMQVLRQGTDFKKLPPPVPDP